MDWIDAATAADWLGVKPATLYAYVSRGVLKRRHEGRRSLFDAAEIDQLARRGRPRNQPPDLVIESSVTTLGLDRPYYRGHDALDLARTATFESVAGLLWADEALAPRPGDLAPRSGDLAPRSGDPAPRSGDPAPRSGDPAPRSGDPASWSGDPTLRSGDPESWVGDPGPWAGDPAALHAARTAQLSLPGGLLPLDRLQVIVTVLGATDTLRHHLDPASVAATGRRLIAGLVDALPPVAEAGSGDVPGTAGSGGREQGAATAPGDVRGTVAEAGDGSVGVAGFGDVSIAERLWPKLTQSPPSAGLLSALRAALILLADHELAASTLAARVAASAKADPYAVVLTGLGVLGGPLHGGASYGAERLLSEVTEPALAPRVIADRVRRGERIPGFGHSVYKNGDARGTTLLDLIGTAAPGHDRLAAAHAVLAETRRRRLPEHNIDLALATLAAVTGMIPGAGEAIFAVARSAGWLAHAMEEYARGSLLRLRASHPPGHRAGVPRHPAGGAS
ncbi:citrate synthase [Nonomuraea typhae]|uniref:citrate synthase n=1 Tax=Nonomuraea typhae TaxID=2603600 RepID=UPI0012FA7B64|nr:citrate synthase [Nonomuraea typhae]